ncbi:serine/threonine-protein kinase [Gemmatimonadota bacterium]
MENQLNEALAPDFEVLRPLGKGRQAEVFLAREVPLDRLVAVKVLSSSLMEDDVARARFEREAKAAASINHPNATSVYRFGILPSGRPYLIMQYTHGRTLEERVDAEGPLSMEDGRRVLKEMAGALASAHDSGFIHRDVRPGNVLCDEETGRMLLTDFGVAGILPSGKSKNPRLTQTGELLGDLKHLCPELLSGGEATEACDIYALGILGYEVLTGEGPYSARPPGRMIAAHLEEDPRPLSNLRVDADPQLEALLARCLTKEPAKRPSAAYLVEALEGKTGTDGVGTAQGVDASGDFLQPLLRKRFPQIVVVTAGAGWILLELVNQWRENEIFGPTFGPIAYKLTLATYLCGIAASGIIAWFHGERGKQKVTPLEIALMTTLGAVWLVVCALILIP